MIRELRGGTLGNGSQALNVVGRGYSVLKIYVRSLSLDALGLAESGNSNPPSIPSLTTVSANHYLSSFYVLSFLQELIVAEPDAEALYVPKSPTTLSRI